MKLKGRENQLEMWYKEFKDLPKLSISDTEKLLKKLYSNLIIEEECKTIKDAIITGTLGEIYKYIKKSGLLLINSSAYGIDDIISASYNIIIEELENKEFLSHSPTFAHYFGPVFTNKMLEKLQIQKINSQEVCKLNNHQMAETLKWYIKEQELENSPSISDIQAYIANNYSFSDELEISDITTIGRLLKKIYIRSFKEEKTSKELPVNKLAIIMPLLIESVIHDRTREIQLEDVESTEDIIQNQLMSEYMIQQIFNIDELTSKQKETIKAFYGIKQPQQNCSEIATETGVSIAAVSARRRDAIQTLKKSKRLYKSHQAL